MNRHKNDFVIFIFLCLSVICANTVYSQTWNGISGTFLSEKKSGVPLSGIQVLSLDEENVLFEINARNGMKDEDVDMTLSGIMTIEEGGKGVFMSVSENAPLRLDFKLEGGNYISIAQDGETPVSLEGKYVFSGVNKGVNEQTVLLFLEHLPVVSSGLKMNAGEYELKYSGEILDSWFFQVNGSLSSDGSHLADFYVARDLSSVYRVDTDVPVKLWGSSKNMFKSSFLVVSDGSGVSMGDTGGERSAFVPYEEPLVSVRPQNSILLEGESCRISVTVPGGLNYSIKQLKSSAPGIVSVSPEGEIKALSSGSAVISCVLVIDDSEKEYSFEITAMFPRLEVYAPEQTIPLELPYQLEAYALRINAPLEFSIEDTSIAAIDKKTGEITGKRKGETTVSITAGKLTRTVKVRFGDERRDIKQILNQANATRQILASGIAGIILLITGIVLYRQGSRLKPAAKADDSPGKENQV